MKTTIKIGSRKSRLAMVQTNLVVDKIKHVAPYLNVEIIPISTVGDEILDKPLIQFGGKGVFVDAFEEALLNGKIDLAVHSAKDMTTQLPPGLGIVGIPEREDPRDVLITLQESQPGKKLLIGTSSLRRQFQIEQFYQAECKSLRGNVGTRIEKLRSGEYDGIILAAAGLKRLKLLEEKDLQYRFFATEEFIPAAGQGILAIEGRLEDELTDIIAQINDTNTEICLNTERRVLQLMNAGCHEAIGVFSEIMDGSITITTVYQSNGKIHKVKEVAPSVEYMHAAENVVKKLNSLQQ